MGSTVLLCLSRACRLRDRSLVRPRGRVTLRLLSSRLPVGSLVRLHLSRGCRLPVGSLVRLHLSRGRRLRVGSTVLLRLSRVVRLRVGSTALPQGLVMLPRLSRGRRLRVGATVLPRPRATPPSLSRKITQTRPRIAMPSRSRRPILSPVPPTLLRLTTLAFLNPLARLSRSRRRPQPTPLLLQQGSLPLSRRRCPPPTR